jgi:predicted lipoprotein with Yx(FWY)xxD motif
MSSPFNPFSETGRVLRAVVPLAAVAALLAGCGSSSSSSSPAAGGSAAVQASSAPAATTAPAASPAAAGSAAASGAGVVVTTKTGALGTYLTDKAGRTLYLWVADTGTKSTCSGSCATAWPPLTTSGAPTAAGSAKASELATTTRDDGTKQVTYDGHPLYYFVGDKTAGATAGQGSDSFGAKWWVVTPAGVAVTKAASAAGPAAPAKSGY